MMTAVVVEAVVVEGGRVVLLIGSGGGAVAVVCSRVLILKMFPTFKMSKMFFTKLNSFSPDKENIFHPTSVISRKRKKE